MFFTNGTSSGNTFLLFSVLALNTPSNFALANTSSTVHLAVSTYVFAINLLK